MSDTTEANMAEDPTPTTIEFADFDRVDIRVGEIVKSEPVPKSKKLLRLEVYLGELGTRTIMAGIAEHYAQPVGQRVLVVVNLAPRKMMGVESHGMLLAGQAASGAVLLTTCPGVEPGTRIG